MTDAISAALTASDTITVIEGFDAMRIFLATVWRRHGRDPEDIAFVLGGAKLADGTPVDTAMWEDWFAAILACRADADVT
jgi:hypothetical protein